MTGEMFAQTTHYKKLNLLHVSAEEPITRNRNSWSNAHQGHCRGGYPYFRSRVFEVSCCHTIIPYILAPVTLYREDVKISGDCFGAA